MYQITTALQKIQSLNKRIHIIQGGTGAGKTIGTLLRLINIAQRGRYEITVVSESLPHLKMAALKDFLDIMHTQKYYNEDYYNRTDRVYTFETGSIMRFFGIKEDIGKVRGPRRDILFINEANNINYDVYDQMEVRTNREIFIDYNPTSEFWVHTEIIAKDPEGLRHDFLKLTYLDNEQLDPRIRASIESRMDRENWWRVYGLGEVGILEGNIYKDWEIIDEVPEAARLEVYGNDFGYSLDPNAIIAIYYLDGAYILDEKLYRSGLTNNQSAGLIKQWPEAPVVCDSAEPKSIDELKAYDINALPSVKGPGSVNYGIQLVQDQKIKVTKSSINLIKEYRNYKWRLGKDGKPMNEPENVWNHAMDAIRYGIAHLKEGEGGGEAVFIGNSVSNENDINYKKESELADPDDDIAFPDNDED
jgi:phage terminase large subunit